MIGTSIPNTSQSGVFNMCCLPAELVCRYRSGDLDDIMVSFVTIPQGHSLAPLLRGLPGDSCQCPHWVLAGQDDNRQLRGPRGDLPGG